MGGLVHVGAWDGREYREDAPRPLLLFEPQARPFAELERSFGGQEGVFLVNAACGAESGQATLYRIEPDHSSSLLHPEWLDGGFSLAGEEQVRVTTVDETLDDLGLHGRFDEMRVDTQGFELEVLKGAERALETLGAVECEIHHRGTYPGAASAGDVNEFLSARGLQVVDYSVRPGDDPMMRFERRG